MISSIFKERSRFHDFHNLDQQEVFDASLFSIDVASVFGSLPTMDQTIYRDTIILIQRKFESGPLQSEGLNTKKFAIISVVADFFARQVLVLRKTPQEALEEFLKKKAQKKAFVQ